jgi:hypothetical protein
LGVLLKDKSWKDTQVSRKQIKASHVALTSKEIENHWETNKWKKYVWVFGQGVEIEKDINILILIRSLIWAYKEISRKKSRLNILSKF